LFLLGIPDGGQLTCGVSLSLTVVGRFDDSLIGLFSSPVLSSASQIPGTCTLSLFRLEHKDEIDSVYGSREPGAAHPDELVEGEYLVFAVHEFEPITFDILLARNMVTAGKVEVPAFCPGGLRESVDEVPSFFFGTYCELEGEEPMTGVTPRFTPSLPLVAVLPSPGAAVFNGDSFAMQIAVSPALILLDAPVDAHTIRVWHSTSDVPNIVQAPLEEEIVSREIFPFGLLYEVPTPSYRLSGYNQETVKMEVDWRIPDVDLDDPTFFITYQLYDYNITFPVTSVDSLFGYPCNMVSMAAYFTQSSYGVENSAVFGRASTLITPSSNCYKAEDMHTPFSVVPMVLFSRGKLHMTIHGTPKLAAYVLNEPVSFAGGQVDAETLFSPSDRHMLVVTFRGTEASLDDWLTNLKATTIKCDDVYYPCSVPDDDDDSSGRIHEGFFEEYQAVRSLLIRMYGRIMMLDPTLTPVMSILFTGHSQGGALATLAELEAGFHFRHHLTADIGAITFGAPRVGFGEFREMQERYVGKNYHWRLETEHDPVVSVPLLYEHVGDSLSYRCDHWFLRHRCHSFYGYLQNAVAGGVQDLLIPWPGRAIFLGDDDVNKFLVRFRETEDETPSSGLSTVAIIAVVLSAVCCVVIVFVCVVGGGIVLSRRRKSASTALGAHVAVSSTTPTHPDATRTRSRSSVRHERKSRASSRRAIHT
jgi:hypothetical protein